MTTEHSMKSERPKPDQQELALIDEATVTYWLGGIGEKSNVQLLELYWGVTNRTALSGEKLTGQEQRLSRRTRLEMLRRVDNRTFPAPALPDNVYKTWCGICWQGKPSNWEVDCGNGCAVVEPYGWVPEDGCPVHDLPYEQDPDPARRAQIALGDSTWIMELDPCQDGCECVDCAPSPDATELEDDWALELGPFGDLDEEDAGIAKDPEGEWVYDTSNVKITDNEMCTRHPDSCDWCSLVQCRSNPDHREWIGENRMKSAETLGAAKEPEQRYTPLELEAMDRELRETREHSRRFRRARLHQNKKPRYYQC